MKLQFEKPQPAVETVAEETPSAIAYQDRRALSEGQFQQLMARLTKEAARRKRFRNIARVTGWVSIANLLGAAVVYVIASVQLGHAADVGIDLESLFVLLKGSVDSNRADVTFGGAWVIITAIILGCSLLARKAARRQMRTTRRLAAFDDLRAVGPLADALALGDPDVREFAEDLLIGLLPRLKATGADLLSSEQRIALRGHGTNNTEFFLALINAWEQIGGKDELRVAQELAAGGGIGKRQEIQEAARDCLPALKLRVALERAKSTLLRPASAEAPAEELLRPVLTPGDVNINVLLRPSLAE